MSKITRYALIIALFSLLSHYPHSSCIAQCSKEGDPAFFLTFEDTLRGYPGEWITVNLGPANFGFASSSCTESDTFCVNITDSKGWEIYSYPYLLEAFELNSGTYFEQSVDILVPPTATIGEVDTIIAVMSFSNSNLDCITDCGDCEDPNWLGGDPYYSMDTTIVIVSEADTLITMHIVQDTLTYIDEGCPYAGVLFSLCTNANIYPCPTTTSYEYTIESKGHIGPKVDTSGTVLDIPSFECEHVLAIIDASEAGISVTDTLTIVAWSMEEPVKYDTCVQLIQVVEAEFVPLFDTPVLILLVILMVLITGIHIKKRSKYRLPKVCIAIFCGYLALASVSSAEAKPKSKRPREIQRETIIPAQTSLHESDMWMISSAAVDTYTIVRYDFEAGDWQGWTRFDNTAQPDTFWHVDDFSGLGLGDFGRLTPLEGSKSMWCGARWDQNDDYLCSWTFPPGYGSSWYQILVSEPLWVPPPLNISYKICVDTEPNWDNVYVEYDAGGLDWKPIAQYDGVHYTTASHNVYVYTGTDDLRKGALPNASGCNTKLRICFISDGAWDDQDGLWNSDGACIIDSITISGSQGVVDYEDFESASAGDKSCGIWRADVPTPFGLYSGLINGLTDKDPCGDNLSSQIVFFSGSAESSIEYPGLYNTPFCVGGAGSGELCHDEIVISPVIDMTRFSTGENHIQDMDIPGDLNRLGGARLKFTVYRDLPVNNLVFYQWMVRDIGPWGCPQAWLDRNFAYYGPEQDYIYSTQEIGDLILREGNGQIQVALGVIDMCPYWCGIYGTGAAHTPSPWFDNIEIQRYETTGPQWYWRDLDLFQDNFPEDDNDLESWVRADMANDLRPSDDPLIYPGDSAVVSVSSPLGGGLDYLPSGEAMVFFHCNVEFLGPDVKPDLYGPQLEGDYGSYLSDDGNWTVFVCAPAAVGLYGSIVEDYYCIDLNDSLLTRGYMVEYYFKATDMAGESSTLPRNAETEGQYFEFTCLPTLASDILYIDDFHGRGTFDGNVDTYMSQAFKAVLPDTSQPDRYDVNSPSRAVSNGPGSRASAYHLEQGYQTIIWDSGNLYECTISDGDDTYSDKSNDCKLLYEWLHLSDHDCGLWILGDDVAGDLEGSSSEYADSLMRIYCGTELSEGSYYSLSGEVTPNAKGTPSGIFYHDGTPDSFLVFGGCPVLNEFDILNPANSGVVTLTYSGSGGTFNYAIQSETVNNMGSQIRTMWFGSSFMYIRDLFLESPMIRYHLMHDVLEWMGSSCDSTLTDTDPPILPGNCLHQNYPNPFNPATTIEYELKNRGPVTLAIYSVAGRLVRILVQENQAPGAHRVSWDGRNTAGHRVASGVYFYRLAAGDHEQTRKMILLK